jgi:serine protease SohB
MLDALIQLTLFSAKTLIIAIFIIIVLVAFFALLAKSKDKIKNRLVIRNLNHKYDDMKDELLYEILPKKELKKHLKEQKAAHKAEEKGDHSKKKMFVLNFHGDIKASAVAQLREEVTAILNVATPKDEVLLRLESPGGAVHGYGLAAAQLMRIRAHNIPLTVAVDKVAASGGYMMACIANKILCAPFAIVGSIGVIVQLPNFHRLLKDKHIDFEQVTAGEYKRTLTMFGQNTEEGRDKLKFEINEIHDLFKNLIHEHRPHIDINKVATGEHWLGLQALDLKLIDEIQTSDEYLFAQSKQAHIFEIAYETKKTFMSKFAGTASMFREKLLGVWL